MNAIFKYIDDVLEKHKMSVYVWLFVLPYILYFITLLGILYIKPSYIHVLGTFVQIYVALFLIFRFNPYRKHEIRPYDDQIILGSAFLLLTNAGVTSYILSKIKGTLTGTL
jgi:hypothetical protein